MSDVRWVSDVRGVGRPKSTVRPRNLQTLCYGDFGRPLSVGRPTLRTSEDGRTSDAELLSSAASFMPFDVGRPNWVGRPMSGVVPSLSWTASSPVAGAWTWGSPWVSPVYLMMQRT